MGSEKSKMNVIQLVTFALKQEGYDGLQQKFSDCACEIGDIAPCGNIGHDCYAGYRHWCEDADCEYTAEHGRHSHMRSTK
jgi:hypothetical protein